MKAPSQAPAKPPTEVQQSPARSQVSQAQSAATPKALSQLASPRGKLPSQLTGGSKAGSQMSMAKQASLLNSKLSQLSRGIDEMGGSRAGTEGLDPEQSRMINSALMAQNQTPRTSFYTQSVDGELTGHFHDDELCQLLKHESDTSQPEVIRKALRKAIRQRVKKLGIKYDTEVCWTLS